MNSKKKQKFPGFSRKHFLCHFAHVKKAAYIFSLATIHGSSLRKLINMSESGCADKAGFSGRGTVTVNYADGTNMIMIRLWEYEPTFYQKKQYEVFFWVGS